MATDEDPRANTSPSLATACGHCRQTTSSMQRCGRCRSQLYCNRDCQRAHRNEHKNVCSSVEEAEAEYTSSESSLTSTTVSSDEDDEEIESTGSPSGSINRNDVTNNTNPSTHTYIHPPHLPALEFRLANPFTALQTGSWLHARPVRDTYTLLLEAYRLRTRDKIDLLARPRSTPLVCSAAGLAHFLGRAATRAPQLLPSWWSAAHADACVALFTHFLHGGGPELRARRRAPPPSAHIATHYADAHMPLQLRVFGCAVCGDHPTALRGTPAATRRRMGALLEEMVRRERCAAGRCGCRRWRLYRAARALEEMDVRGTREVVRDGRVLVIVGDVVVGDLEVRDGVVTLGGEGRDDDESDEEEDSLSE